SLNKSGAGTWILSSNSTYSGNTTISGGTLRLTGVGANSIPSSPRISVGTGATLDVMGLAASTMMLGSGGNQTLAAPAPSTGGPPNSGAVSGSLEVTSGSAISSGSGSNLAVAGGVTLDAGSISNFALGAP